jgi:putative CocE/NonD family hydrolase
MRDGAELLADHYLPRTAQPAGTLLVRTPYGRGFPFSTIYAGVFATRGYHVIMQSVRGTFGSGGVFAPAVNEVCDGADTAAWLRDQPWYTGTFATVGLSYLGQTQWALMESPPPDMVAAVVVVGLHDFPASCWGTGAFAVNGFLGWSYMVAHQEDPGLLRAAQRQLSGGRAVARTVAEVPLGAAGRALLGAGAPWWEDWIGHAETADPFWDRFRFTGAVDTARVPVLLIGGWQDVFLEQTLAQYQALHRRGVDVALTIGPWTHNSVLTRGGPVVLRESLEWLRSHFTPALACPRSPVRIFVTGGAGWADLPQWPPATSQRVFYLESGRLADAPVVGSTHTSTFTFDPRDPTPTVGGRLLSADSGYRRDDRLAERTDVLAFTTEPLAADLYVYGAPAVELSHESDNPYVDLFVRISEVDRKGHSRNVSDGYRRLVRDPGQPTVRLELDEIAHRFRAGTRVRVLVAGGSHPRYTRNLGTGQAQITGAHMRGARHVIAHGGRSRLLLPVGAARPSAQ